MDGRNKNTATTTTTTTTTTTNNPPPPPPPLPPPPLVIVTFLVTQNTITWAVLNYLTFHTANVWRRHLTTLFN